MIIIIIIIITTTTTTIRMFKQKGKYYAWDICISHRTIGGSRMLYCSFYMTLMKCSTHRRKQQIGKSVQRSKKMPQFACNQGKPWLCEQMQFSAKQAHVNCICFNNWRLAREAIALFAVISGLTCKRGDRVNSSLYWPCSLVCARL